MLDNPTNVIDSTLSHEHQKPHESQEPQYLTPNRPKPKPLDLKIRLGNRMKTEILKVNNAGISPLYDKSGSISSPKKYSVDNNDYNNQIYKEIYPRRRIYSQTEIKLKEINSDDGDNDDEGNFAADYEINGGSGLEVNNQELMKKFQRYLELRVLQKRNKNSNVEENLQGDNAMRNMNNDNDNDTIQYGDKILKNIKIAKIIKNVSKKIDNTTKDKAEKFENKMKIFQSIPGYQNAASFVRELYQNKSGFYTKLDELLGGVDIDSKTRKSDADPDRLSPSKDKLLPSKDSLSPLKDKSSPLKDKSSPLKEKFSPLKDKSSPLKDKSSPLKDKSLPLKDNANDPKNNSVKRKTKLTNPDINDGASNSKDMNQKFHEVLSKSKAYKASMRKYKSTDITFENLFGDQLNTHLKHEKELSIVIHDENADHRFYDNLINDLIDEKFVHVEAPIQQLNFDTEKMQSDLEKFIQEDSILENMLKIDSNPDDPDDPNSRRRQLQQQQLQLLEEMDQRAAQIAMILKKQSAKFTKKPTKPNKPTGKKDNHDYHHLHQIPKDVFLDHMRKDPLLDHVKKDQAPLEDPQKGPVFDHSQKDISLEYACQANQEPEELRISQVEHEQVYTLPHEHNRKDPIDGIKLRALRKSASDISEQITQRSQKELCSLPPIGKSISLNNKEKGLSLSPIKDKVNPIKKVYHNGKVSNPSQNFAIKTNKAFNSLPNEDDGHHHNDISFETDKTRELLKKSKSISELNIHYARNTKSMDLSNNHKADGTASVEYNNKALGLGTHKEPNQRDISVKKSSLSNLLLPGITRKKPPIIKREIPQGLWKEALEGNHVKNDIKNQHAKGKRINTKFNIDSKSEPPNQPHRFNFCTDISQLNLNPSTNTSIYQVSNSNNNNHRHNPLPNSLKIMSQDSYCLPNRKYSASLNKIPNIKPNSNLHEAKKLIDEFIDQVDDLKFQYHISKYDLIKEIKQAKIEYNQKMHMILPALNKMDYLKPDKRPIHYINSCSGGMGKKGLSIFLSN